VYCCKDSHVASYFCWLIFCISFCVESAFGSIQVEISLIAFEIIDAVGNNHTLGKAEGRPVAFPGTGGDPTQNLTTVPKMEFDIPS
jgi:hypothetical protein